MYLCTPCNYLTIQNGQEERIEEKPLKDNISEIYIY
jgi:hypothetical protein